MARRNGGFGLKTTAAGATVSRSVCDIRYTTRPRIALSSNPLPRLGHRRKWRPPFVQRRRNHDHTAGENRQPACNADGGWKHVVKVAASRFPAQHEIQHLQNELNAFNDRIIELENEGHRGHAMEVLKAKAIDFARQIDELRCLLVGPPS